VRDAGRNSRVIVVAFIVGVIAIAVALDLGGGEAAPHAKGAAAAGPTVTGDDAVSTTWYCAEGTGSAGRASETIVIGNLGDEEARADITVMPGGDNEPATRRITVPKRGQLRIPVASVLEAAEKPDPAGTITGPGVVVEVFGGRSVVEHAIDGRAEAQLDVAVGPCARDAGRHWYFAAGTTERGAEHSIALFNPFADDAILDLSFVTDAGLVAPADLQSLVVPRRSRVTVPVANFVRRQAQIGAEVNVRTGRVVAEQSLAFTSENETRRGVTLSLGTPAPAASWTLPGVVSEEGAAHAVYIANFGAAAAEVEVAPRLEDENTVTPSTVQIAGRSAVAVDLRPLVAAGVGFGVEVRATRSMPIVAELLASWGPPARTAGSAAALGTPVPKRAWAFSVTRFTADDTASLSVFNPNERAATVKLLVYAGGTPPADVAELSLPGEKQATIDLAELAVTPEHLVVLRADAPVVATRRILGPGGAALAPGVPDPHAP
jgi:hypothetical protein